MEPDERSGRVPDVNLRADEAYLPPTVYELLPRADFTEFYAATRSRLVKAVTATIGDTDLALDAVDEAMTRAYQRWSRVATLDNPSGWIYRVAVNWATSALRRRRVRPSGRHHFTELPPAAEPDISRALAELDVRQRAVVVCRYLLGWSESQTATALNIPVGTVKSRLHRANRQLSVRLHHLRPEEL